MRIKVSEYIADFLVRHGVSTVFTVVGGGAMHLNDSLGHHPGLHCVYNHHEQACAIAAEAYQRVNNHMAVACVTSGPGAVNALNGVVGAYQDSIPMLVLSGQCKYTLTVKHSGLNLRTLGNQEFDIVSALDNMTKYAEMLDSPQKIAYCLEKACHLAVSGRPGPCWLDIPLDIQGAVVETEELEHYCPQPDPGLTVPAEAVEEVARLLSAAQRPVLYAGNGIRLSGGVEAFRRLVAQLNIPVVTCWDSVDLIETEDSHYAGRGGTMGDRAGNFAVQNSDFVLAVGTRLNIYQVGYDVTTWARAAKVAAVDIDPEELKKPTVRIDLPICCDARVFLNALLDATASIQTQFDPWAEQCCRWKKTYPVLQPHMIRAEGRVNIYHFIDTLSRALPEKSVTVVTNGSASVVGSQTYYIGKDCRFLMNCGLSSMGYGLPAAVGASVANDCKTVICLEGDGSIMMNLQELQTMVTNHLPIKLFVINNEGYHQIRLTQTNMFHSNYVGIGPQSGDLGFPSFEKLAAAFGLAYQRIESNADVSCGVERALTQEGPLLCEVMCTTDQIFEPKSSAKRLPDGRIVSPPLEDLAPFLPHEELKENMYIDLLDDRS